MQRRIFRLVLASWFMLAAAAAWPGAKETTWHAVFQMNWLGPAEAHLVLSEDGDVIRGRTNSGAMNVLAGLPGDQQIDDALVAFEAERQADGSYLGTFTAPWREGELRFTIADGSLEGTVSGGAFAGSLRAQQVSQVKQLRDYNEVLAQFDAVMGSKVFDPSDLYAPGYITFRDTLRQVAEVATDDFDLLFGIAWAWQNDPFSHFSFKRSEHSAAQMFTHFDNYRVGFEAATVEFRDDIAILKVRTMMGADTIEQIEAAYERIAAVGPSALIIDLRGNTGGAFAVKPLVEHVIDAPLDAGYFLSQVWNREHDRLPSRDEVLGTDPWHGWSIVSFWEAVQSDGLLRVQFQPAEPNFDGPVYVLVDGSAASATELAADALRASGLATLIGEKTAGEMLSQSMFDVGDGFLVSLPVADYISLAHGRIEGQGVPVHIEAAPDMAMEVAREQLAGTAN